MGKLRISLSGRSSSDKVMQDSDNPKFLQKLDDATFDANMDFRDKSDLLRLLPAWFGELANDQTSTLTDHMLWKYVLARSYLRELLHESQLWSVRTAIDGIRKENSRMAWAMQKTADSSQKTQNPDADSPKDHQLSETATSRETIASNRLLVERFRSLVSEVYDLLSTCQDSRIEATKKDTTCKKLRLVCLMEELNLSSDEITLFEYLLFVSTRVFAGFLLPDNNNSFFMRSTRSNPSCFKISQICNVEPEAVLHFFSKPRKHCKDGTVSSVTYLNSAPDQLREETNAVLCGQKITEDIMLLLEKTTLHKVLVDEGNEFSTDAAKPTIASEPEDESAIRKSLGMNDDLYKLLQDELDREEELNKADNKDEVDAAEFLENEDELENMPYVSDVGYIQDCFLHVSAQIKASNAARVLEQDGLEIHGVQEENEPDPYGYEYMGRKPNKQKEKNKSERKHRTAQMVVRKLETRIEKRLIQTKKQSNWTPRLIRLSEALGLTDFERYVVIALIGTQVNPGVLFKEESYMRSDHLRYQFRVDIRMILNWFSPSLTAVIKNRSFFYKTATLVKEGIIIVGSDGDIGQDLTTAEIQLDRRMLDFVMGLETEVGEIMDGSNLYSPKTNLEDVVIPDTHRDLIMDTVKNFNTYSKVMKSLDLESSKLGYGSGIVLLFYGPSGTGKTMLANALAKQLKKKVLLINFPQLGANSAGIIIKMIFREARVHDAIVFFDECESIFMSRDRDYSHKVNTVLAEMERYDGLCILATNRPQEIDEAMHRRITLAVEFKKPDHVLREKIWNNLRPKDLKVADDVNVGELALKYELTGGFIKNAWVSAINVAVGRDGEDLVVKQEDLRKGCAHQLRGRLSLVDFDRRVVPTHGLDDVVLSTKVREELQQIVDYNKSQSILFNQWGFSEKHGGTKGIAALFHGIPGTGKTLAATCIGYDLGKPVKLVNCSQVLSKWVGETGKNIDALFEEATSLDAVLVFDECEALFGARSGRDARHETLNVGILLHHLQSFNGVVILCTNIKEQIDKAFFRRLKFSVEFPMPKRKLRAKIWKALVPEKMPTQGKIDYNELATKFEIAGGNIKNAIFRAAMKASLATDDKKRKVSQKDLEYFATQEVEKEANSKLSDNVATMYA